MYLAVCDDLQSEREGIIAALERWQSRRGAHLRYRVFNNASDMLDAAREERFTLYLLDILMPGLDGLEASREIRSFDESAEIVFLTTAPGFAYESYGVRALDYLLKPVEEELLFALLDKLWFAEQRPAEGMTVKSGYSLIRVLFSALSHVEVNGKQLYFNLVDGSVHQAAGTMREVETVLLARPEFARIHRSYIVNLYQVAELSATGVCTFAGQVLPVSRLLYQQVQEKYMNLLFAERREGEG